MEIDMAKRSSIYIPDRLRSVLDVGDEGRLSARVAAVIGRYGWLISTGRVAMSRAEWCVVLDALNGWGSFADAGDTMMIGLMQEVADHIRLNGAGEKWGLSEPDCRALLARLAALSPVERISVGESAERFWRRHQLPTDEAMAEAGIVPADDPAESPPTH